MQGEMDADSATIQRIAETLQRSMLQVPPDGRFPRLQVETLYEADPNESDLGGDFFDAFALSEERVALVVGDVSSKGLFAAARTTEVKYALRAFLHEHQAPEIALARLNNFICKTHRLDADSGETFIILALVVVDTVTGNTTLSSAGAEPTLILRLDGTAEQVTIIGLPLDLHGGIEEHWKRSGKAPRPCVEICSKRAADKVKSSWQIMVVLLKV